LFPNVPSSYYEHFHKEPMLKILLGSLYHLKEMKIFPPFYAYFLPAGSAEGA
jgi:hypothetical protein